MSRRFDDNLKKRCLRSGSVLVMVVVLTVLLALIGVLFVVMARMDNMSASGIANNADLHAGVEAVVDQIKSVMVKDLFQAAPFQPDERVEIGEMQDSPATGIDRWLASLEPERFLGGDYRWPYISDLYQADFVPMGKIEKLERDGFIDSSGVVSRIGLEAKIILPNDVITYPYSFLINQYSEDGAPADADGDGVSDSRWVVIPKMRSTKGKDIYAAVRIIDNCAMLNLNTAHTKNASTDPNDFPDDSGYLSAVDYERFLRGSDTNNDGTIDTPPALDNIRVARNRSGLPGTAEDHHDNVVMHIENPGPNYSLFDIGDELEIRNRYMLTSKVESRFERIDVANYTLDAGGSRYAALSIPRTGSTFEQWKWRVNPDNFDGTSGGNATEAWKYDRRHVCTFYSFDRNLRRRDYPLVDVVGDITGTPLAPTPWTIGVPPLNIKDYSLLTPIITPAITPAEILSTFDQDVFMIENAPVDLKEDFYSNTLQSRKNILYLLYAFRAYYIDNDPVVATDQNIVADAARRAAQYVANMIDYVDDTNPTTEGPFFGADYGTQTNDNVTYIDRSVIRQLIFDVSGDVLGVGNEIDIDLPLPVGTNPYEFGLGLDDAANGFDETVYGYERQPFISEMVTTTNNGGAINTFAVELCNPYLIQIDLAGWQIVVGPENQGRTYSFPVDPFDLAGRIAPYVPASNTLGRLTIYDGGGGLAKIKASQTVKLQRPDPANPGDYITIDETELAQTVHLVPGSQIPNATFASKRDDTNWRFVDSSRYTNDGIDTLDAANGVTPADAMGYQLPVANNNTAISSLHDFAMVTFLGNTGPNYDPINNPVSNPITKQIGQSAAEGDVRFDIAAVPALLEYANFVINRPERRLPGRININTATKEVLRAAIPEVTPWWDNAVDGYADTLAADIVSGRPYDDIGKLLLKVSAFKGLADDGSSIDANIGDLEIEDDFEERDWILSRLANIFTVRSDTFTAYILVRLGVDGPQKRMIAILDRTGVFSPGDRPKLVALHPVPDPR